MRRTPTNALPSRHMASTLVELCQACISPSLRQFLNWSFCSSDCVNYVTKLTQ